MSISEDVEKLKEKAEQIENETFAMSILKDYKKQNKRLFIIIIMILIMWFLTGCYLVYILNDIGEETVTETYDVVQESDENGNNNFINRSENVNNG